MRRKKQNGGKTMRKRQNNKSSVLFWLMAVAALGIIIPLAHEPVHAAADACASYSKTADSDGDGFVDYEECNGITFYGGGTFPGYKNRTGDRKQYLDPNSKDLFVIMAPATGGYFNSLGANRLEYIYNSASNGGLGISTHEIASNKAAADRTVCKAATGYTCTKPTGQTVLQKAVKGTENLNDGGTGANRNILASSSSMHGTPNGTDLCMIYTVRIKNSIQEKCGCQNIDKADASNTCNGCCDNATPQTCGQALFYKYIKHTIAHEIAHQLMLTITNDPTWGWHYPEGTGVDLDYMSYFDGASFIVGTVFTGADYSGARLK
jgi:hypothetical protein